MKIKLLISVFLLSVQIVSAQMTLNDCLIYARDHAHNNMIGRIQTEKAGADKRIAAAGFMPSLDLTSNGNISFGRNIDPETNTYDNKKTLYTGFGLQMSVPVFDGLVNVNSYKAARVAQLRQVKSAQIEQDRISLEVIKAFYNVFYCRAMVEQMKQQLERDSTDLVATEKGLEIGTKSGADVAEMRALVASDHYELTNQRSLLEKSYLSLRSCMGMELTDEPLSLIEEPYDSDNSLNSVHPRIAEAELALKESVYNLHSARGSFSPRIYLSAGISTSYYKMIGSDMLAPGFSKQWHDNMGEYIGFSVAIPLFSGLSKINRVKKAGLQLAESRIILERTRYDIERETAEASLDLKTSEDEYIAADRRLDAENLAYKAVRRKFELGDASAIDLYTSGAKLATARAALEGKRIQRIINRITLDYYLGKKLIKE